MGDNLSARLPGGLRLVSGPSLDLLVLLVASAPALAPLSASGYLWGHDAEDPPWRSLELAQSLSQWVLFPRWSADLFCGYGFPLFNFQSPLSFYPAALLSMISPIGLLDASKASFALALLLTAVGGYLVARHIVGDRRAALLAGVLYLYAPATIGDVYVRSTLAGSAALAVLPFALYAFLSLSERPSPFKAAATALLVAALVLTHNITAAVGLGMMGAYAVLQCWIGRDWRNFLPAGLSLVLGTGLAAFYLVPSLAEVGLTHAAQVSAQSFDFWDQFVDPLGNVRTNFDSRYYLITSWGPFDLHLAYPYGPPPYKLGLLQGLLLMVAGVVLVAGRARPAAVVALFLTAHLLFFGHLSWSRGIWQIVPASSFLQFPWRLTRPLGLPLAVAAAWALLQLPRPWNRGIMLLVGFAAALSALALAPMELKPFRYGSEITPQTVLRWQELNPGRAGTTTDGQFLPLSVQWEDFGLEKLMQRYGQSFPDEEWVAQTAFLPPHSRAWILSTRRGQQWIQARVEAADATTVAFRTIYFPAWTAYVDGQRVPVEPSPWREYEEGRRAALGVSQVEVPQGTHLVTLQFEDTPVRRFADGISGLCLLAVGVLFAVALRRRSVPAISRRYLALMTGLVVISVAVGTAYLIVASSRTPDWVANPILRDLLEEAGQHRLELSSPAGTRVEDYVFRKSFTIQGDSLPVLYMHPPSSAATRVWLPEGARLEFALGVDPAVWDKPGDGVEFRIVVREGEAVTPVFSRYVDPKARPSDRKWIEESVDLSGFAHREVEVILSTGHAGSPDFDWAGWASPRIVLP